MKFKVIAIILFTAVIILTGCQQAQTPDTPNHSGTSTTTITNPSENNEDDYQTIGTVIQIDGTDLHVMMGDVVEIFQVTEASAQSILLGEEVMIQELKNGNLSATPYLIEDFETRHTNMGQIITSLIGTITKIESKDDTTLLTIETADQERSATYYGDQELAEGIKYDFDFVEFSPDELSLIAVYDKTNQLHVNVQELIRAETGELMVYAIDNSGVEYTFGTYYADKNFNLSELAVGDELDVYTTALMESFPVQLEANRIYKTN